MPDKKIGVLCVDDHRIVRDGLALIINREPDMETVGLAETAGESVDLFRRCRPSVTLMDLQLGTIGGIEAMRVIRSIDPAALIVVLTMSQGEEDIHAAMQAGAAAYLLKDTVGADLVQVIRDVHEGRQPKFGAEVQARLDERATHPQLSPREVQVIELISHGLRNKEIAEALDISDETVQTYVKSILAKFRVHDRTAAVRVALRRGIIHIGE